MHERHTSRSAGHRHPDPPAQGLSGTGLVADDLYLLGHDDRSGKPLLQPRALGTGLAGALLTELMLAGCIGLRHDGTVVITRDTPQDAVQQHPLLKQVADEPGPQPVRSWLRFLAHSAAGRRQRRDPCLHLPHPAAALGGSRPRPADPPRRPHRARRRRRQGPAAAGRRNRPPGSLGRLTAPAL